MLYLALEFLRSIGRKSARWFFGAIFLLSALIIGVPVFLFLIHRVNKATKAIRKDTASLDQKLKQARLDMAQGQPAHRALGLHELEPSAYAMIRKDHDRFIEVEKRLKAFSAQQQAPLPAWARFMGRPFYHFAIAFHTYNQGMGTFLSLLDQDQQDGVFFKHQTDSALWHSRNKAYDYVV